MIVFYKKHEAHISGMFLSTRGLSNLPRLKERNDFDFIVGQEHYVCPSLIADFLSPHLANLHQIDPSISRIAIKTKDDSNNFGQFLNVGFGVPLSVNDSNSLFLRSLCVELGNSELYAMIIKQTPSTVLERVFGMSSLGIDFVDKEDISDVASMFWQMSTSDLASLSPEILNSILCDPQLTLASKDSLFELISNQVQSGHELYFDSLAHVQIEFLSKESAQQYFNLVCDNFDRLNLNHWRSLQWRIVGESRALAHHYRGPFPPNSETKGIIWYLTSVCGGNVHEKGEVIVTASSVHANGGTISWEAKHAVDHSIDTHFHANNSGNEWICFDFKKRMIEPTHYSVCSGWHPLKSWKVEGSMDGKSWTLLDNQKNNSDVNTDQKSFTFPVLSSRALQMIRLTQTGPCHQGTNWFMLRRFKVFGMLI
jgi:hypothetical protein